MNLELHNSGSQSSSLSMLILILIISGLIFNPGSRVEAGNETTNIGVIINVGSRAGMEQETAMKIAAQNFNNKSRNHKLFIHFKNISSDPMQAISAAGDLITEKQVRVIIGMESWEQAALVADVGKRSQVPVLSFAAASIAPPLLQLRWPFLIQMATNISEEISCMASIVQSYGWRKIIAIYEDEAIGGDSSSITLLSDALQSVGAEVEYHLALPPFHSLTNPNGFIQEELLKLLSKQSRVFIVLRSSLSLATNLFNVAKQIGLMGRDSVWILGNSLSSLLDSVDKSFISSAQGAVGIKIHHSENTTHFTDFEGQFQKLYRSEYPEEGHLLPGYHALQAYDSIMTVAEAVKNLGINETRTSEVLLQKILSSDFTGLSGNIQFQNGMLSNRSIFSIVNIVGRSYKDLGFWSSASGFSDSLRADVENERTGYSDAVDGMKKLSSIITWPGELNRDPKGWAMPTNAKPLKIGVPGRTSFAKFVKVEWVENLHREKFDGFCIDLFEEVIKVLEQNYSIPYEFCPYNGTYDALVDHVINKTFDAVVGDITILANRSRYVEFTQPFAESGLSMVVKVNRSKKAWIFMKPFTWSMWIGTLAILFYTTFVIWFMEHQSNPEFKGPWRAQLGTALWFTFSSLFFAHRETIYSNYTKAVMIMWLFVVFVLASGYTASLTSMLTVPRLEPSVTNIGAIQRTNEPVGCDGDSFVKDYLRNVLKIHNIKTINDQHDYPEVLNNGSIKAAFLEVPYKKVFLKEYCNDFTEAEPSFRFGGLGFAFQKGSPIARDVSEAILTLSENGKLKRLEDEWFGSSQDCSSDDSSNETESLSFESFWVLYLISGTISTICFLIFFIRLIRRIATVHQEYHDVASSHKSIRRKVVKIVRMIGFVQYLSNITHRSPSRAPTFANNVEGDYDRSSSWILVSTSESSQNIVASPQVEVEIAKMI